MKQRILTGWSMIRVLYLVLGLVLLVQSYIEKQWLGVFIGGYFTSMGIFAFGCAAKTCCGIHTNSNKVETQNNGSKENVFKELK